MERKYFLDCYDHLSSFIQIPGEYLNTPIRICYQKYPKYPLPKTKFEIFPHYHQLIDFVDCVILSEETVKKEMNFINYNYYDGNQLKFSVPQKTIFIKKVVLKIKHLNDDRIYEVKRDDLQQVFLFMEKIGYGLLTEINSENKNKLHVNIYLKDKMISDKDYVTLTGDFSFNYKWEK